MSMITTDRYVVQNVFPTGVRSVGPRTLVREEAVRSVALRTGVEFAEVLERLEDMESGALLEFACRDPQQTHRVLVRREACFGHDVSCRSNR